MLHPIWSRLRLPQTFKLFESLRRSPCTPMLHISYAASVRTRTHVFNLSLLLWAPNLDHAEPRSAWFLVYELFAQRLGRRQTSKGAPDCCRITTAPPCSVGVPHLIMPSPASRVGLCTLTGSASRAGDRAPWCTLVAVTARSLLKRSSVGGGGVQPGMRTRGGRMLLMLWSSSRVSKEATSASCGHAVIVVERALQLHLQLVMS